MFLTLMSAASAVASFPGLASGDIVFPSKQVATSIAYITIPIGILLLVLARMFWRGQQLALVAGYKKYGVAEPQRMGRFVGALIGALGVFQMIFPFLVRMWGQGAFIAFVFVVVGIGVAIIIGGAHFERG